MVGQAYADYYSDRGLGGVREDQKSQQEGGNNAPGAQKGFPLIGVCTYGMLSQSADLEAATDVSNEFSDNFEHKDWRI